MFGQAGGSPAAGGSAPSSKSGGKGGGAGEPSQMGGAMSAAGGTSIGGTPGGATGGAGGAGGGSEGTAAPPGGVAWEPWPAVPAVAAGICQVALFHGGDALSAAVTPETEVREFDPTSGIMTVHYAPFGSLPAELGYGVFDTQGRPLGSCNVSVAPYACLEWIRDPQGNVIYEDRPNFTERNFTLALLDRSRFGKTLRGAATATYTLKYDDAGSLSSARFPYDATTALQVFTEDSQHRCTDVLLSQPWSGRSRWPTAAAGWSRWSWAQRPRTPMSYATES